MNNSFIFRKNKKFSSFEKLLRIPFWLSSISILVFIYDFGFQRQPNELEYLFLVYIVTIIAGCFSLIGRYILKATRPRLKSLPFDLILLVLLLCMIIQYCGITSIELPIFLQNSFWLYFATAAVFLREFSALNLSFKRTIVNPAQLFIFSFLFIIVIGTFLLMLPNATYSRISFLDALFTSTSAVCVTGLTVQDTATYFTEFGQIIIIFLIQIGGLGIMTFASYFSYFFRGSSTYENQIMLHEMTDTEKMAEVFGTLKRIILITFIVEATGALIIYECVGKSLIMFQSDRIFFSIFHAISAFCNAGFSTLTNNLYDPALRYNYSLQMTIALLVILGGIGFPILFNLLRFIALKLKFWFLKIIGKKPAKTAPWIINLNTRIVLNTTLLLLLVGTILFFVLEYHNTLYEHSFGGKLAISFFSAVTPRTAGFNVVNVSALHISTLLITILLMWIGASPASTGGGIKTSSIAVAWLNILSIIRGKQRVEAFKREISPVSIHRAFAVIFLSIFVIFLSIFFVSIFETDKGILNIAVECISAFGTVGLSTGITPHLCGASKIVLILTMFVGRINMLTILIAFFKKSSTWVGRYPSESILIN